MFVRNRTPSSNATVSTQRACNEAKSCSEVSIGVTRLSGSSRPVGFIVGLDLRLIFGERQFEADVGVQVTVGHVMHELPHRPSFRPIRRVELLLVQAVNRGTQIRWQLSQDSDVVRAARAASASVAGTFHSNLPMG